MRSSPTDRTAARAGPTTPATSSTGRRPPRDGGYALIELVLALAVLGLVAGIVLPRAARAPGPIELRAAAEEIAALLRSDRNSAIRERREVLSQIDVAEGVVASTSLQRAVRVPPGVRIEFVQSSNEVRDGGEGGIRFLPDGRSSGGALSLQRDDALYRISVNWLTGSVLVSAPDT